MVKHPHHAHHHEHEPQHDQRDLLLNGAPANEDVWPIFGYQGESFSQGGYIERGFDDIDWL